MVADMHDAPAQPAAGALVLVVGPSGAGKDTLIDYTRIQLASDDRIVFARRVITRKASASGGEPHDEMTEAAFLAARARGEFALSWHSHGLYYGIPIAVVHRVASGAVVVANVSRTVIPTAGAIATRRLVVNVTARPEILAARLAQRGRETPDDIASRVARAVEIDLAGADFAEISNEASVEEGGALLLDLLLRLAHVTLPPRPPT